MIGRLLLLLGFAFWLLGCQPAKELDGGQSTDQQTDTNTDTDNNSDGDTTVVTPVLSQVSGHITYQDRTYNDTGFITGNTPEKAARRVVVDLLDANGNLVASSQTDDQGQYLFEQVSAGDYTLRILARAVAETGETIAVYNLSETLYAVSASVSYSETEPTADLNIPLSTRMAGPFNMLDVMLSGMEFYHHYTAQAAALNDLNLYWEYGSSNGTFTCLGTFGNCSKGSGIYVLSDPYSSGDTDEFDDDVLWHEFAHHIEFSTGLTDSPGGAHSLVDTHLDLRLSWSEGMANYFQTAVKTWLRSTHPERLSLPTNKVTYYIDTRSSFVNIGLDLANLSGTFSYATNEGAVAKALIGLQNQAGQSRVWAPIADTMITNIHADTLEAYWDGLLQSQPTNLELAEWRAVLSEREIQYQRDGLETDQLFTDAPSRDCTYTNQTLPADCVTGELHTLYRASGQVDTDTLAITVSAGVRYAVWTHDLRNGADTRIGLYRADGSPLTDGNGEELINDDAIDCELQNTGCNPLHNGSHFASAIEFVADADTVLYLVMDSADAAWTDPGSYGYLARYGDYAVSVQLLESGVAF